MIELPDFDKMLEIGERIANNKISLELKKVELETLLAEITILVTKEKKYWLDGKAPSNAHIKDTFQIIGYNAESKAHLKELRESIAKLEGEIKRDQLTLGVYESIIGVWRTQSANERGDFFS